jgi:hypothetical protein
MTTTITPTPTPISRGGRDAHLVFGLEMYSYHNTNNNNNNDINTDKNNSSSRVQPMHAADSPSLCLPCVVLVLLPRLNAMYSVLFSLPLFYQSQVVVRIAT